MIDREEREKVIEILQYEKKTALHDNKWAFDYAIASIKTDLKYDLLYEKTSGQVDKQADKPTTKNDLEVDCISRAEAIKCLECDFDITGKENMKTVVNYINSAHDKIVNLPSVTPQLSSGLEKNSKKLESIATPKDDLGVDYLGVDCISRKAVQTRLKEIINEMETIFADIREREVDDSVCGLCEYDCDHGLDGFANECPGFEKDDCFKLKEKYRAEWLDISYLPSVTPQEPRKGHWIEHPRTKELRFHHIYECSACKTQIIGNRYNVGNYKYCPHCGIEFEVEG